jgi:large subunit ribosomal protein L22
METQATKKYIRSSPRKMRIVIDLIRGKKASEAFSILRFNKKLAATDAEKLLRSALSNLSNLEDGKSVNYDEVRVKEVFVNEGPTMKRISAAPMGRAYRIKKRSNHLTIVVETLEKK